MKCSFSSGKQTHCGRPIKRMYVAHSFEIQEHCKRKRPRFHHFSPTAPKLETNGEDLQKLKRPRATGPARKIAEAVLLQAVEDLWNPVHRKESIQFFTGEGFVIYARLVGMGMYEKLRLIQIIKKALSKRNSAPRQSLKQMLV